MPPKLALSLCILFVAVLLLLDVRRKTSLSLATWLPTTWMMYCGSRPLSYWFDPEIVAAPHLDYTEGSPVDRAFLTILIISGLAILCTRKLPWSKLRRDNVWILTFFAYMALSLLWSDYPTVSLKRWVRTTGDLIMVLLVLTEASPLEGIKAIFRRSAFVLLPLSIVLIKYFPAIGREYTEDGRATMWIGVTTQKNDLGYVAMVCGLYFVHSIVASWKKRRQVAFLDVLFLMLALWLLAGSSTASSKTAVATFGLGVCLLMVFHLLPTNPNKMFPTYGFALVLMLLFITITTVYGPPGESAVTAFGRDTTLTGRTDIWRLVLDIGPRNELLGRGYGSFWIGNLANDIWSKIYTPIQQSHNGYIDIYIELGGLGLTLLACLVLSAYKSTRQALATNLDYGTFRMVFLPVILIHNLTESSFARPTQLMWFLFLLICTNISSVRHLKNGRHGQ
jgi:exopolysaccharide production protein ExoQ